MISNSYVRTFLAIDRFEELVKTFKRESDKVPETQLGTSRVFAAIIIGLLPAAAAYLHIAAKTLDVTTVFVGIAACLAILFRVYHRIPFYSVARWKESLSAVHTAVAVGCIPTVIIVIWYPEALFSMVESEVAENAPGIVVKPSLARSLLFIFTVSVWAGITEEFIYRGLIISVLRRWHGFSTQRRRDIFAILVSSAVFAVSHFQTWGPEMSIALFGLGIGFGIAFIAVGELMLPLIIYHILFDALSLSFAMISLKL